MALAGQQVFRIAIMKSFAWASLPCTRRLREQNRTSTNQCELKTLDRCLIIWFLDFPPSHRLEFSVSLLKKLLYFSRLYKNKQLPVCSLLCSPECVFVLLVVTFRVTLFFTLSFHSFNLSVTEGCFGAYSLIDIQNEGPVTIVLDSVKESEKMK